jgi:hypothetical protein
MDPPQRSDDTLSIFAVMGGLAAGPQIKASIIQPAAYWTQRMPGGSPDPLRLTLKTDGGALIYVTYDGVFRHTEIH